MVLKPCHPPAKDRRRPSRPAPPRPAHDGPRLRLVRRHRGRGADGGLSHGRSDPSPRRIADDRPAPAPPPTVIASGSSAPPASPAAGSHASRCPETRWRGPPPAASARKAARRFRMGAPRPATLRVLRVCQRCGRISHASRRDGPFNGSPPCSTMAAMQVGETRRSGGWAGTSGTAAAGALRARRRACYGPAQPAGAAPGTPCRTGGGSHERRGIHHSADRPAAR